METSFYQELKLQVLNCIDLSKDAIHIHIGLVAFLLAILFWKKGRASAACLIPVFLIATAMEVLDLRDDWQTLGYFRWSASIHDLGNTTLWPLAIYLWLRFRSAK